MKRDLVMELDEMRGRQRTSQLLEQEENTSLRNIAASPAVLRPERTIQEQAELELQNIQTQNDAHSQLKASWNSQHSQLSTPFMRPFEGAGAALKLSQMTETPFLFEPSQTLTIEKRKASGQKREFGRGLSFQHGNQEQGRSLERRLSIGCFQLPEPLEQNPSTHLSVGRVSRQIKDRKLSNFDGEKGDLFSARDVGMADLSRVPSVGGYQQSSSDLAISGRADERNGPLIQPFFENGLECNATKFRRAILGSATGTQGLLYQSDLTALDDFGHTGACADQWVMEADIDEIHRNDDLFAIQNQTDNPFNLVGDRTVAEPQRLLQQLQLQDHAEAAFQDAISPENLCQPASLAMPFDSQDNARAEQPGLDVRGQVSELGEAVTSASTTKEARKLGNFESQSGEIKTLPADSQQVRSSEQQQPLQLIEPQNSVKRQRSPKSADIQSELEEEKSLGSHVAALTGCSNERYEKRRQKVLKYLYKKQRRYQESEQSKIDRFYEVRKRVADKRLRVKGRFVTHSQAMKMLGLTYEDLKNSVELQRLCSDQASMQTRLDSIFQAKNGQRTHIKNLQVLFTDVGLVKKAAALQGSSAQNASGNLQQVLSLDNKGGPSESCPHAASNQFFILGQHMTAEQLTLASKPLHHCAKCERFTANERQEQEAPTIFKIDKVPGHSLFASQRLFYDQV